MQLYGNSQLSNTVRRNYWERSDNIENNDNDWTGHTLNYHNEEEYEGKVTGRRMMMRRREGKVLSL